jgi:hypothetical protein
MRILFKALSILILLNVATFGAKADELAADSNNGKLGRLFTTRGEREKIDDKRQQKTPNSRSISTRKPEEDAIKLNGVARSNNSQPHVWLNGERADTAEVNVLFNPGSSTGGVDVFLLELNQPISLQPGQTYTRSDKERYEAFELKKPTVPAEEDAP